MSEKKKEEIARALLKVLKKDDAYRQFSDAQEFYRQVGQEIAKARKKRKLSTAEFASRIGKKETDVTRMEKGEYKQYTIPLLFKIAEATSANIHITFDS